MVAISDTKPELRLGDRALIACIQLVLPALAFAQFATRNHFSVDSYLNYYFIDTDVFPRAGRLVSWAITSLESALGINLLHAQPFWTVFFIVFTAAMGYWLSCMVIRAARLEDNRAAIVAIALGIAVSFTNVFIWEWYTFVESYLWYAATLAFSVGAVACLPKRFGFALSVACVSCAAMAYQIAVPMVAVWGALVVLAKHDFDLTRNSALELAKLLAVCACGTAIALLLPRLLDALGIIELTRSGTGSLAQIAENLRALWQLQHAYWIEGIGFLPRYSQTAFALVGAALVVFGSLRKGRGVGKTALILLALAACFGIALAPHAIVTIPWFAPRTLEPVACFWSALWVCAACLCLPNGEQIREQRLLAVAPFAVAIAAVVAFLGVQIINCQSATRAHFLANDADERFALEVEACIEDYEKKSGTEVRTLLFANDVDPTWTPYENAPYRFYGTNERATVVEWATPYLINYYTNRSFEGQKMSDEQRDQIFGEKRNDLDFDQSQVVCQGDTAYVLVY